jgi:hypothetical protein
MHHLITRASLYVLAAAGVAALIGALAPDFAAGAFVTALGIAIVQGRVRR